MASELSRNPYVVGPPVTGESLYGRQDVFQFINESLAAPTNRVIVLHGQRRTGKSSVLHELHLHRLPQEKYRAVRIDVQGQAQTPFSIFAHDLAIHIAEVLQMPEPELPDFEENDKYLVQQFLPEALNVLEQRRLVIMVDEFDALAKKEDDTSNSAATSTAVRFLTTLQTILDNDKFSQIVFIFVIGSSLERLPPNFRQLVKDARFNRIWLLSRPDTETLITQPAADMLTYELEAIDRIWHYTSGHPYFTQLLCYEVFNRAKRRQQPLVQANDFDQIIGAALERGRPGFVWLWDDLSVAERLFVSAIASAAFETGVAQKEEIQDILNENRIRLGNVDLIEAANQLVRERVLQLEEKGSYRFEVELVRHWVMKNHNITQEKLKISEISRSAISYYNVARRSHDRGRLEAAIEGYRLALQDNPNHFNAQLGLAQALQGQGRVEEAVEEFEDAYWLNPEASLSGLLGVRLALAERLEEKGQDIEAAVHYRRMNELAPDHRPLQEKLKIFYDKGERARNRERWAEAIEFFGRLVDIDPHYSDARQRLLEILYNQGQEAELAEKWVKAAQFYGQVIELEADYKDVAQRYDSIESKARVKTTLPAPRESYAPLIAIVVAALVIVGGVGGWLMWNRGSNQSTPTATQAIAVIDDTPISEPTPEPTIESTKEPTPVLTPQSTPLPTVGSTTPTAEPTPTSTSTPTPILIQTEEPTQEPTTAPTETPSPTPEPTATPTQKPTEEPTAEPKPLPPGEALDIDFIPGTSGKLFTLLKDGSIYRTEDGGNAWTEILASNSFGLSLLVIAPSSSEIIYVGGFGQILKSTDGGDNWRVLPLSGPVQVHDLAIAGSNIVYAATDSGILISQDGGENWVNGKEANGEVLQTAFYAVTVTADSNAPVYATGEGDVIYRTDGPGIGWKSLVCQGCTRAFYAVVAKGNTVYVGGADAKLFRSDNGGFDWQLANNHIPDSTVPTLDIASITIDTQNDNTIYASTGFRANNANGRGIFKSINGGDSWSRLPLPPGAGNTYYVQNVAIDPTSPEIIYIAGFGGVHKSTDGGQTWVKQ